MLDLNQLEDVVWSVADGRATDDEIALLHADKAASLRTIDRLIAEAEEDLEAVRSLPGEERDQVVADFNEMLESLHSTAARLRPPPPVVHVPSPPELEDEPVVVGEVELQASWIGGQVVAWAGGRGTPTEDNEQLAARLESIGGPPLGWEVHPGVTLPGGQRAESVAIPLSAALGWLVAVGSTETPEGVGLSVRWLGRVAVEAVRLVARGAIVPTLRVGRRGADGTVAASVHWTPALLDNALIDALAAAMPGTVVPADGGNGNGVRRSVVIDVITTAVETIVGTSVERMDLPPAPDSALTADDLQAAVIARMDGTPFRAHATLASDLSQQLARWSRVLTDPKRPRLVLQLAAPDHGGVWMLSVLAPLGHRGLLRLDEATRIERHNGPVTNEWKRLGDMLPERQRAALTRGGQVALSQDEAWRFMTDGGPVLAGIGFDVRVPALSRRKAKPSLRLFTEAVSGSVVGAHQLSNVSWTALFDDVELTSAEIRVLAKQARPLVQSHGRWVEVDRVDLEAAAAALAERESITQLSGAEILRHSIGIDGSGLAGGVVVEGDGWASDIVRRATETSLAPVEAPDGFVGTLRSYQAEAVGWIGFLEAAGLGGCLALDMGLGKTPTVLAHLARTAADAKALVIAPAAVVGNWAAEAAKFVPGRRVMVHHGASRSTAEEFAAAAADADIVITTYATAVRDVETLARTEWHSLVLDEAQAIKNATSETAQQLRRLAAHTKLALTGTPIENGLGDLWAILDFTNPGLVGSRPAFIAQMSGDGETALRALNGILLFRRTKAEPEVAAELPDKIDELDHCSMTAEQIGLYQAVLDELVQNVESDTSGEPKQGAILAAITALKQICNHPAAYRDDGQPLAGRSGKLARLEELVESVFESGERILIFTHFASWGRRLADHLTEVTGVPISCYDGSLSRTARDRLVSEFQTGEGPGALVLSLKAGGTGLNLTAANHVVLYDRWWNPAVEDQARDRAWRIGQGRTVISHRLVCPGTIDERVEEVVAGKRHIANLVLPKSSSLADLEPDQLRMALGLQADELIVEDDQ
ncbi:DEAD/DEAH box helicase [Desertimonas flava]|uniref:DEAD/DEAH box helicase n=1 Tax=Desertimonas flava TaxID=2064846 RepID=UPI0013C4628A|nr:DEAD/DEAH box helicase [Desertimonas flava]